PGVARALRDPRRRAGHLPDPAAPGGAADRRARRQRLALLGGLRVVAGDEDAGAVAPRAGHGLRLAAEAGDHAAGAATGGAALGIVWLAHARATLASRPPRAVSRARSVVLSASALA